MTNTDNVGNRLISELASLVADLKVLNDDLEEINNIMATGSPIDVNSEIIKRYIDSSDRESQIYDKTEILCKLILANPWALDGVEWNSSAERDMFVKNVNMILSSVGESRELSKRAKELALAVSIISA